MLAVSDAQYYLPYREQGVNGAAWRIQRIGSDEVIITRNLSYTIDARVLGDDVKRITFEYRGDSVKAAPRTLRIVGAALVSGFTAKLAGLQKPRLFIEFIENQDGVGWHIVEAKSTDKVFGSQA
jgi:hypothetical protein